MRVPRIMGRTLPLALIVGFFACSESRPAISTPTSLTSVETSGTSTTAAHIASPTKFGVIEGLVTFPPRNEPNAFFQNLQVLYRDTLRRSQTTTYVDGEGQNVWLTEYFRFYLNGCSHQESMTRTLQQISTGTTLSTCGSEVSTFPPRNLPNEFQTQLEATYRDVLRRPQVQTYVDSEGANVWMAQYLRLRTTGQCNHAQAESKVFDEIRGAGVQADCAPQLFTLSGRLTGSNGSPVSGATITIIDGQYAGQRTASDSNGSYSLTRVSGSFTLRIERSGYDTLTRSVNVTQNTSVDVVVTVTVVVTTPTPTPTTPPTTGGTRTGAICRDGTTSTATGSGACSSHGGVSCWLYSDGSCRAS